MRYVGMRYDSDNFLIADGMAVIKQYDPALYARMMADLLTVDTEMPFWYSAFGGTAPLGCPGARGCAYVSLNGMAILAWAAQNEVPAEMFAATVLAHEYAHTHQPCEGGPGQEAPAFRAGSAFAAKLPSPYGARIKEESDRDLAHVLGSDGE